MITLKQFQEWVDRNQNITWDLRSFGIDGHVPRYKYFDLGFDTRTQNVFRIVARGGTSDEIVVHVGDLREHPDCCNLLDLLDKKINDRKS